MSEGMDFQRDTLNERGWIDRWGFLLFAFGGGAAILLSKAFGLTAVPVAILAALAMVAYAVIVNVSGTGRLRADQAGDNCYYLGLIYTLISLAYAIFFFDPTTTATTVVQGFGIALATTIMGLILRVFFNQMRVDLVQTEDTARIELAEAAGRLKTVLQSITVSMSDYGLETRQALEELRTDFAAQLKEQVSETTGRVKRMSAATDKVISGIEKHAEAMLGIEKSTDTIAASLSGLEDAANRTQENLGKLSHRAEDMAVAHDTLAQAGVELRQSVIDVTAQVKHFDGTASLFNQNITKHMDDVKNSPLAAAEKTADALTLVANTMKEQLEAVTQAQSDFIANLNRSTADSAKILERQNSALEQDLIQSRENVGKVHTALVEMTGELVNNVKASKA